MNTNVGTLNLQFSKRLAESWYVMYFSRIRQAWRSVCFCVSWKSKITGIEWKIWWMTWKVYIKSIAVTVFFNWKLWKVIRNVWPVGRVVRISGVVYPFGVAYEIMRVETCWAARPAFRCHFAQNIQKNVRRTEMSGIPSTLRIWCITFNSHLRKNTWNKIKIQSNLWIRIHIIAFFLQLNK